MANSSSWLMEMNGKMSEVVYMGDDIMTVSYLAVLEAVPPIYDKLFPSAVAGIMKGDITGGVAVVREAMATIPGGKGATLQGMIKYHIETLGKDKCAAEKKNGTKSLLWLNRAATFICMMLRNLSDGMETKDAAYDAYEKVLKPYHGWMTQQVVGNAVSLGPLRDDIYKKMELTHEAAAEQVPAFCSAMEKLSAHVKKLLVDNDAHFETTA
mmetsp:Transcript_36894/g.84566  ORF Transcript_36894/g.84566 Transcript_36894/m.84566 type:complete len:211 (+) Transcript_36894:110-742(+)